MKLLWHNKRHAIVSADMQTKARVTWAHSQDRLRTIYYALRIQPKQRVTREELHQRLDRQLDVIEGMQQRAKEFDPNLEQRNLEQRNGR